MSEAQICESSTAEPPKDANEEETATCNRIFLNFNREPRHPIKDRYNLLKVKELFKCLSEMKELQEMKVSGWLEKEKEGGGESCEDEESNGLESYRDGEEPSKGCGQRFAMSRDFWYRKLNTLKAQKLDEVALEAEDIPPEGKPKVPKCMKLIKNQKIYSDEVPEKREDVMNEIHQFNVTVAKPVEKELKRKFVNVYDNRNYFRGNCK